MARNAGLTAVRTRHRRRRVWLVCILAMAAALLIRTLWIGPSPQSLSASTTSTFSPSDGVRRHVSGDRIAEDREPIAVTWPVALRRDVFVWESVLPSVVEEQRPQSTLAPKSSPSVLEDAQASLNLTAILGGSSPQAMINDQLVRPGDQVNGFTITRIERSCVTVTRDGIETALCLRGHLSRSHSAQKTQTPSQSTP